MGILNKGLLGAVSGKVGPVIGVIRKAMAILRSLPKKSKKKASDDQVLNRNKFGSISTLLSEFRELIEIGFYDKKEPGTQMERAISWNLKHVFGIDGMQVKPDLSKLVLSMGTLFRTTGAKLISGPDKSLRLTWNDDEEHWSDQHAMQRGADYAMVAVVYKIKKDNNVHIYYEQGRRADLELNLQLKYADIKHPVHLWLFFASEDRTAASKSEYFQTMLAQD